MDKKMVSAGMAAIVFFVVYLATNYILGNPVNSVAAAISALVFGIVLFLWRKYFEK
jgi:membrane associated rhomboid family serine protease